MVQTYKLPQSCCPSLFFSDPAAAFPPPAPPSSPADATLVLAPEECLLHFTAPEPLRSNSKPPPENVERLRVLTNPGVWAGGEGGGGSDGRSNPTRPVWGEVQWRGVIALHAAA